MAGDSKLSGTVHDDEYNPYDLARRRYRENLWLRSLLTGVAQGLERMAARDRRLA